MSLPLSKPCLEINTQVTLPANSGYTWLYDSTDPRCLDGRNTVALGATAGVRTPGVLRGQAKNKRIMLSASCTGQNVTLVTYLLDGNGAWQLIGSGTAITAAAVPNTQNLTVLTPDFLIGFQAGATAPSGIATTCLITEQP